MVKNRNHTSSIAFNSTHSPQSHLHSLSGNHLKSKYFSVRLGKLLYMKHLPFVTFQKKVIFPLKCKIRSTFVNGTIPSALLLPDVLLCPFPLSPPTRCAFHHQILPFRIEREDCIFERAQDDSNSLPNAFSSSSPLLPAINLHTTYQTTEMMLSVRFKCIRIGQKGILPLWFGHPLQTITKP